MSSFDDRLKQAIQAYADLDQSSSTLQSMISKYGSVGAVKQLINSTTLSSGFEKLWKIDRLDLSLEYIILEPEWNDLFSANERRKAKLKLMQCSPKLFS